MRGGEEALERGEEGGGGGARAREDGGGGAGRRGREEEEVGGGEEDEGARGGEEPAGGGGGGARVRQGGELLPRHGGDSLENWRVKRSCVLCREETVYGPIYIFLQISKSVFFSCTNFSLKSYSKRERVCVAQPILQ